MAKKTNTCRFCTARRPQMPMLSVEERQGNLREVELGMDEHTVQEECKRCLRCDLEWLEEMGLALEPMPEREVVADEYVREADEYVRAMSTSG